MVLNAIRVCIHVHFTGGDGHYVAASQASFFAILAACAIALKKGNQAIFYYKGYMAQKGYSRGYCMLTR